MNPVARLGFGFRLGTSRRALGGGAPPAPADYVVTNDAEWDTVFANTTATLNNKIVEISGTNFTRRNISNKDFKALGGTLTIRSANASSKLLSLDLTGTVKGINFSGLHFQMQGWPFTYAHIVYFNGGTYDDLVFNNGTSFRHGYGVGLADFDMAATYDEYTRVDNVRTATTTSTTYALTWEDTPPSPADGEIYFFNRGAQTVYVAFGNSGVTVSVGGGTTCPAGQLTRISSGITPVGTTHMAIITATGTSEVNARTEIGFSQYLAAAFGASGSANVERITIQGCTFRDLNNAIKGIPSPSVRGVVMDNDFDRIYQDICALVPLPGGTSYVLRNLFSTPFSRSGIAENLNGDARDPHGDAQQGFGPVSPTGAIGPIYSAGNRQRRASLRTGAVHQGIFWSDNDFNPSYNNVYSISDSYVGGNVNGINSGEASYPLGNMMVYGATVLNPTDIAGGGSAVRLNTDGNYTVYVGYTIAQDFIVSASAFDQDNVLDVTAAASPSAVFPSIANLTTASTRAQIESAITPAAEGVGLGAVAAANAVDWNTTDHTAVILWANVPSGVSWNDQTNVAINTVITLPKKKVLNRRTGQAVVPGSGVEWQKLATDGTTVLQAWTTSTGTVEPDQFIQARRTSAATGLTAVNLDITINGFLSRTVLETAVGTPTSWLVMPSPAGYFVDPSNVPASTTRITFRGKFYFSGVGASYLNVFTQESTGCDLQVSTNGWRCTVEDSTGATMLASTVFSGTPTFANGTWYNVIFDVDQTAKTATLTLNGVSYQRTWSGGTGTFNTAREVSFLATTVGGTPLPVNTRVADLSVDFNGTLRKAISNTATTANADAWKRGTNFTQGP